MLYGYLDQTPRTIIVRIALPSVIHTVTIPCPFHSMCIHTTVLVKKFSLLFWPALLLFWNCPIVILEYLVQAHTDSPIWARFTRKLRISSTSQSTQQVQLILKDNLRYLRFCILFVSISVQSQTCSCAPFRTSLQTGKGNFSPSLCPLYLTSFNSHILM